MEEKTGPCPGLFGQRSILGVMPDWNPAEMIGILPRPLATSLYRNLITSGVWAKARASMGYRQLPPTELMPLIFWRPYIDVRASLNSFLPPALDAVTCEALVGAWLERLDNNPQFHDKIEFEIAQTALDFTFDQNLDERYPGLLSATRRQDFKNALKTLTTFCLNANGTISSALDAISELRGRQLGRPLIDRGNPGNLNSLQLLLAECRKFGTLPFSILARHAFIAESLLRSAAERGAITPDRIRRFKLSVRTISGEMSEEFRQVCEGQRDSAAFMRKYGHLRPGSYDILSPRYADRQSLFHSSGGIALQEEAPKFMPTKAEKHALTMLLGEYGLSIEPDALFTYAAQSIAGREYAKFIFSRNLSDILEIIAFVGETYGFDREAISFLDLQSLLDWKEKALPESPTEYFGRLIEYNRHIFSSSSNLKLGYLIRSVRDVYVAPQHRAAPNFVGTKAVTAKVVCLKPQSSCEQSLEGKIVCIENADPGFDWIFTRGIVGLITRFGGTNSHMAIRCAEYGLPAAIGVGERLYDMVSQSDLILLDPVFARIKPQ